jgi:taurine dioxygenase
MGNPATGAMLYMVEMPSTGGNTYWANLQLAYDALPQAMKTRLEGVCAIFSYAKRQAGYQEEKPLAQSIQRQTPDVVHPIVNVHPRTGVKSLYLDPSTTSGIVGMPDHEGQQLLDDLTAHATRPEFVYKHDWQIGDLIMWDNALVLHRRDPFDMAENRLLKRTTVRLSPERHILPRVG